MLVTVKVAMIQLFTDRLCTVDSPDGVVMKSEMHTHSTRHSCPALHYLLSLVWLDLGVGLREGENAVIMSEKLHKKVLIMMFIHNLQHHGKCFC